MQPTGKNLDWKLHRARGRGRASPDGGSEENVGKHKGDVWKIDQVKKNYLTQQISNLKQGDMSIATVYNKLSTLWNELEAAKEKFDWPDPIQQQYK